MDVRLESRVYWQRKVSWPRKGGGETGPRATGRRAVGFRNQWLIGSGLVLFLSVMALLLSGLLTPVTGTAAPGPSQVSVPASEGGIGFTDVLSSYTAFLPIVSRAELIEPNIWTAEYYANPTLSGNARYTREEVRVDYDWGSGAPSGLPGNYFSIRWTGTWDFEVGVTTFFVFADDGVRLWFDEQLLINSWAPGRASHQATVTVTEAGLHSLRLEYFEDTGDAAIRLHWRRTDLYPRWQGDYYGNPWVEGRKAFSQIDDVIQFDWEMEGPPGLPDDAFSVRWEANPVFEPGTHRIFMYADEGYQLTIDGSLASEGGWYTADGGAEDVVHTLEASGVEYHRITYNFHDRGTLAEARLWIQHVEHPQWRVEYYANTSLSGSPTLVKYEDWVFYDWGLGKPRPGMPSANHFSIRWSGQRYFHAGCYRFGLFADDGVRLRVDGELLVDEWQAGRGEYHSPVTYLGSGYHEVILEYFEDVGEAEIRLWWE